jgi:hypothetical protein
MGDRLPHEMKLETIARDRLHINAAVIDVDRAGSIIVGGEEEGKGAATLYDGEETTQFRQEPFGDHSTAVAKSVAHDDGTSVIVYRSNGFGLLAFHNEDETRTEEEAFSAVALNNHPVILANKETILEVEETAFRPRIRINMNPIAVAYEPNKNVLAVSDGNRVTVYAPEVQSAITLIGKEHGINRILNIGVEGEELFLVHKTGGGVTIDTLAYGKDMEGFFNPAQESAFSYTKRGGYFHIKQPGEKTENTLELSQPVFYQLRNRYNEKGLNAAIAGSMVAILKKGSVNLYERKD